MPGSGSGGGGAGPAGCSAHSAVRPEEELREFLEQLHRVSQPPSSLGDEELGLRPSSSEPVEV